MEQTRVLITENGAAFDDKLLNGRVDDSKRIAYLHSILDSATAVCGGGPAFVAYISAAMHEFSMVHGCSSEQSNMMVSQVLLGTAKLLQLSGKSAQNIYEEVMRPNGTTEQGMKSQFSF